MRVHLQSLMIFALLLSPLSFQSCTKKNENKQTRVELLRLNLQRDVATMDPRRGADMISSHLHFMLFEGLTRLDQNGTNHPAQAKSISLSDDRKTYTFYLRDCLWSDGTQVTAYDYEYSWKTILSPNFPAANAPLLYPIKNAEKAKKGAASIDEVGIYALDEKTLMVELEQPTPYFLQLTSFCVLFPVKKNLDIADPEWIYRAGESFISNGPYILRHWKHKDEIVVEKNPHYWNKNEVLVGTIHMSIIENESTALKMFEKGYLDMIGAPLSPIPTDALHTFFKEGRLTTCPIGGSTIIAFNTQKFPFENIHLRKAFSLAIDRAAITENITQLGEDPAVEVIPPVLKNGHSRAFFKDNDISAARMYLDKGLQELGIKASDLHLTYCYENTEIYHKIAQALQQQWKNVLGIQVNLENIENKILMDRLVKRDYVFAQAIWVAQYHDPMNILERYKFRTNPKNYAAWENERYKELLEQSALAKDTIERESILEDAEAIFVEEMPVCPIYHWRFSFMMQPHLNVPLSPIGDINFTQITLNPLSDNKIVKR